MSTTQKTTPTSTRFLVGVLMVIVGVVAAIAGAPIVPAIGVACLGAWIVVSGPPESH